MYPPDKPAKEIQDGWLKCTVQWKMIKEHYGDRRANRSGVPYINHIIEGCHLLFSLSPDIKLVRIAQEAFCLHPFTQDFAHLDRFIHVVKEHRFTWSPCETVILAMEYARCAASFLPKDMGNVEKFPQISSISAVNIMLIADKIQNRKDLLVHNKSLKDFGKLITYFDIWLCALQVNSVKANALSAYIMG